MRRPGTDESNVQMSDVLCDFCHAPWTEDQPMIEGHQGSCMCGRCLTVAYVELVHTRGEPPLTSFKCTMCLEDENDRAAINRTGEPGWASPAYPQAVACRRCVKLGAGALHKDGDHAWSRPQAETAASSHEPQQHRADSADDD